MIACAKTNTLFFLVIIFCILFICGAIPNQAYACSAGMIDPAVPKQSKPFIVNFDLNASDKNNQYEVILYCRDQKSLDIMTDINGNDLGNRAAPADPLQGYNMGCMATQKSGKKIEISVSGVMVVAAIPPDFTPNTTECTITISEKDKDCLDIGGETCSSTFIISDVFPGAPIENECQSVFIDKTSDVKVPGISTALGCIPYQPQWFVSWIFRYVVPLGGGIGFLLLLKSGFGLMAAAGNPEKIQKAQGGIMAVVSGLLFMILAIYLLNFIGVHIIRIPGFSQ